MLSFAALLSSCTEPITIDLNNGDNLKLVVNALIDDLDRPQEINLSLTSNYFDTLAQEMAIGALVSLTKGNETFNADEEKPGTYVFNQDLNLQVGDSLFLRIDYKDDVITSKTKVHRTMVIDTAYAENIPPDPGDEIEGGELYGLFMSMQELPGEGDHYMFHSRGISEPRVLTLENIFTVSDMGVDGFYFEGVELNDWVGNPGDTIIMEVLGVSEETFAYEQAIYNQTFNQGNPFSPPPANVPTNIVGDDARGHFIASAVNQFQVIIE